MDIETLSFISGDEFLIDYTNKTDLDDIEPFLAEEEERTIDTSVFNSKTKNNTISQGSTYMRYFTSLQYFICLKNRSKSSMAQLFHKPPKREYVRTKLIRGHKRAIRQSLRNQLPIKTVNKLNHSDPQQLEAWKKFKDFNQMHKNFLDQLSKTEEGPNTDGKNKRLEGARVNEKTFNNPFCIQYFSDPIVQESFKLYASSIFEGKSCDENCDGFAFSCCERTKPHTQSCKELWKKFEEEVKIEFVDVLLRAQNHEEV